MNYDLMIERSNASMNLKFSSCLPDTSPLRMLKYTMCI